MGDRLRFYRRVTRSLKAITQPNYPTQLQPNQLTMDYAILDDRRLKITLTTEERNELIDASIERDPEYSIGSHVSALDWTEILEPLICNSELQYLAPLHLGGLIDEDFECLAIMDKAIASDGSNIKYWLETDIELNGLIVGNDGDRIYFEPIAKAWVYEDSAYTSPIDSLIRSGYCLFNLIYEGLSTE